MIKGKALKATMQMEAEAYEGGQTKTQITPYKIYYSKYLLPC